MSFLCGETIKDRLNELIELEDGSNPDDNQIDCNSYELKIGREVYITSEDGQRKSEPYKLEHSHMFTIPSGQFALLITEEIISIPKDLFGFISLKSKYKYKGLINISGFHVDPGWKGRLQFSVYNAGPHNITLKCGDKAFLIWFATLDKPEYTDNYCKQIPKADMQLNITSDNINNTHGQVYSPQSLNSRIDKLDFKLRAIVIGAAITFIAGFALGLAIDLGTDYLAYHKGYRQELIKGLVDEMMAREKTKQENRLKPKEVLEPQQNNDKKPKENEKSKKT